MGYVITILFMVMGLTFITIMSTKYSIVKRFLYFVLCLVNASLIYILFWFTELVFHDFWGSKILDKLAIITSYIFFCILSVFICAITNIIIEE